MTIVLNAETFAAAIRAIAPHASTDPDRPILTGVQISARVSLDPPGVDAVSVIGTDSYTLARAEFAVPRTSATNAFDVVVPAAPLLAWATTPLGTEDVWCDIGECEAPDVEGCVDECVSPTASLRRRHGEVAIGIADNDTGEVFVLDDVDGGVTLAVRTINGVYPNTATILDQSSPDLTTDIDCHVNPVYLQRCWQSARAWSGDAHYPLHLLGLPDRVRALRFAVARPAVGTLTGALMPVRFP